MTIPFERTRALIKTKAFLQELQDPARTPQVPAAVREHALALLRHYPTYYDIERAHKALPMIFGPAPPFSRLTGDPQTVGVIAAAKSGSLQIGKSGVLRATTVAAARALMTQDMAAGHRETPDVGTPRVKVTVHAPKVAAFLERRNLLQSRERKVPKLSACAKGVQTCDVCVYKQYEAQDGRIVTSQTCARCGASSAER